MLESCRGLTIRFPMIKYGLSVAIALLVLSAGAEATKWQTLTGCVLVDNDSNDADSFVVRAGNDTIHLRLYFVDAPESFVGTDADAKRVR